MLINVKGEQANVPNTVGAASSFSEARTILLVHNGATARLVTVASENVNSATIGSLTMLGNTTQIIEKNNTDVVYVDAGATLKGTKVGYSIS